MDFLFYFSAISVLPFWFMMIIFPQSELTARVVRSPWICLPAAACYLILGLPHIPELLMIFASPSPDSLAMVMSKPWAASMFWAYAGAFDLFVGRWIYFDSREQAANPLLLSLILFICIFSGPVAFIFYWCVKTASLLKNK